MYFAQVILFFVESSLDSGSPSIFLCLCFSPVVTSIDLSFIDAQLQLGPFVIFELEEL